MVFIKRLLTSHKPSLSHFTYFSTSSNSTAVSSQKKSEPLMEQINQGFKKNSGILGFAKYVIGAAVFILAEVINIKIQSKSTETKLDDTKNELYTTKTELNSKIDSTKTELNSKIDSTKNELNSKIDSTKNELNTTLLNIQNSIKEMNSDLKPLVKVNSMSIDRLNDFVWSLKLIEMARKVIKEQDQ